MKKYLVQAQVLLEIEVKASSEEEAQMKMINYISNESCNIDTWDWNILIECEQFINLKTTNSDKFKELYGK